MNSKTNFFNSERIRVSTFDDALVKCASIRKTDLNKPYIIEISGGTVNREIKFPFSNFWIIGISPVTVKFDSCAKKLDQDGKELTTWRTPVFKVMGNNCIFENFIFKNTAGNPEINGQQVALAIYGNNNSFINCQMHSTQDTLFLGPLPDDLITRYQNFLPNDERLIEGNLINYFKCCKIEGTIDFIFGAGQGIFDQCQIVSLPSNRDNCAIAPAHSMKDDIGFIFYKCQFTSSQTTPYVYLSRPWRDYGKCVFIKCDYGPHIKSIGFLNWSQTARDKTARYEEYPYKSWRVSWVKNTSNTNIPQRYIELINNGE